MSPLRHRFALLATLLLSCGVLRAESFAVRAFYVDHRTEVMTLPALESLVDKASACGMTHIVMEWEATFPFESNSTLRSAGAFTREEFDRFMDYAQKRGVSIIPLQNCFGHCEYILSHERYASVREDSRDFSQVCPSQTENAKRIFASIFSEIAAAHPSPYMHIGCDETRLLGHCRKCAKRASEVGVAQLYCDYVAQMCEMVKSLGKIPVIWGDIVERYPEMISSLPEGIVVADWNYGWKASEAEIDALRERGVTLWGASSLRCAPDNIHLTQWDVHFDNLREYVPFCREKGFEGMIQTSWSTSGRYGYLMDDKQVIALQPIRQVYPMSAHNVLLEAFAEAVSEENAIDVEDFVSRYALERFGLEDASALMRLFSTPQLPVDGKHFSADRIESELESARITREMLAGVKPAKGKAEWSQYVLMLDIRLNYLAYNKVRAQFESSASYDVAALKAELKSLLKESESLRRRFVKAQEGYLKDPSAPLGEWSYIEGMRRLYDSL